MYQRLVKSLISALVLSITLSGCRPLLAPESRSDTIRSLMLGQDCTMPCWAGIQVGVTKSDEAKGILQNQYGAENLNTEYGNLSWSEKNGNVDGVKDGIISFTDGVASEILLTFDNEANLKVRDLIRFLGEPAAAAVSWSGPITPNAPCLGISLHYPNRGVLAILDANDKYKGVNASQLVSVLRFLSVSDGKAWTVSDAKKLEWKGYQDYCKLALMNLNNP